MESPPLPKRFVLRDLPLAARLVATVFLLSVGVGYASAMVQLHFQHASKGNPMPTVADVVAKFSGVDWEEFRAGQPAKPEVPPPAPPEPPRAAGAAKPVVAAALAKKGDPVRIKAIFDTRCLVCHGGAGRKGEKKSLTDLRDYADIQELLPPTDTKLLDLITADETTEKFSGDGTMRPAFTTKSDGWREAIAERPEGVVRKEREGEVEAVVAWVKAPPAARQKAYEEDRFTLPAEWAERPMTPTFLLDEKTKPGETKPVEVVKPVVKKRSAKSRQTSVTALTQSTHAHLLSFAMLYALTGLVFAFSSYPGWARATLAPVVLLAQLIDIGCWWLARLDGVGPYFALGILGTGAVVGVGLTLQIVLSVFNMYDGKGKTVLLVLALVAAGGTGVLYNKVIGPQLAAERAEVEAPNAKPAEPPVSPPNGNKPEPVVRAVGDKMPHLE